MCTTVTVFIEWEKSGIFNQQSYEAIVESNLDDRYLGTDIGKSPEEINARYCSEDTVKYRNRNEEVIEFPSETRKSRNVIGLPVYDQKLKLIGTVSEALHEQSERWLCVKESNFRFSKFEHVTAKQGGNLKEHLRLN